MGVRDSEMASAYAQTKSLWYKYSNPPNPVIRGQEDRIFSFMEGMLSKKMAFSLLMRLITIFALAFVSPSVMAQFTTILSVEDVSYAADNQVGRGEVVVSVTFGKAVDMSTIAAKVELRTTNEFGGLIASRDADPEIGEAQVVAVAHKYPDRADGQNFTLTFRVDATATVKNDIPYKSALRVAEVPAIAIGDTETSAVADITIYYVGPPVTGETGGVPNTKPRPVRIAFAYNLLVLAAGFTDDTFDIIVTLSEQPKENLFTASHLTVVNGTADSGVYLGAILPIDGADTDKNADAATGRDGMHHWYLFRITPAAVVGDLVIKLNDFEDQEKPVSNRYIAPPGDITRVEGLEMLTVKINKPAPVRAGIKVRVPAGIVIPGRGYLVAARNDGSNDADTHALRTNSTQIVYPGDPTQDPELSVRASHKEKYNLIKADNLPNLEAFLANGGVIDVVSLHDLVITEVMWGTDASLRTPSHNQWIELYNAGGAYKTTADTTYLVFYGANEIPKPLNPGGTLPYGVTDRIGTVDAQNKYWSIAGKGQSGRTGQGEAVTAARGVVPRQDVISMYRVADATSGKYADGTQESSWRQSERPSVNFNLLAIGVRIGTPGADRIITPSEAKRIADAAAAKAEAAAAGAAAAKAANTFVSMPQVGQIYISEVMFAGGGTLPQWIEIANGSRSERVNLSGWTLTVENATADADVSVGAEAVFRIPEGTRIDPSGQHKTPSTVLVVTELGQHNLNAGRGRMGRDQIISLWTEQRSVLIDAGVTKFRYSLLSDMAFKITLAPPAGTHNNAQQ